MKSINIPQHNTASPAGVINILRRESYLSGRIRLYAYRNEVATGVGYDSVIPHEYYMRIKTPPSTKINHMQTLCTSCPCEKGGQYHLLLVFRNKPAGNCKPFPALTPAFGAHTAGRKGWRAVSAVMAIKQDSLASGLGRRHAEHAFRVDTRTVSARTSLSAGSLSGFDGCFVVCFIHDASSYVLSNQCLGKSPVLFNNSA